MPNPLGNRALILNGTAPYTASIDMNKPIPTTTSSYVSVLFNLSSSYGLTSGGDFFLAQSPQNGVSITSMISRLFIKLGPVAETYQLGILNNIGGVTSASYDSRIFTTGSTNLIVFKTEAPAAGGRITSSLWINPDLTKPEQTPDAYSAVGTGTLTAPGITSVLIRQTTPSPIAFIDEIRADNLRSRVVPTLQLADVKIAETASYVTPYETAWTSYTPQWTSDATQPTLGNGTIQGAYKLIGKTCHSQVGLGYYDNRRFWSMVFQFAFIGIECIWFADALLDIE
jgi:hypothetical protein